jgi:WD40 repeat protein
MFSLSNESNKLLKKFKVHKGAVRTVEFDKTGKYLISGSKDKSFKITDIVRLFYFFN